MERTIKLSYLQALVRSIKVEVLKIKSPALLLALVGVPFLAVLIGSGSFYVNQEALRGDKWFDLWTQVALFYGYFFYPLLMSIIAAYMWRLEHLGHNWNTLLTLPYSLSTIWFSKLIVLFFLSFIAQGICLAFYLLSGKFLLGLSWSFPEQFWYWLIAGPVFIMAFISIQSFIAMLTKSFAAPVGISFILSISGLLGYRNGWFFWPPTLSIIGINAQHEGLPSLIEIIKCLGTDLIWIIGISILAIIYLRKKEV